MARPARYTYVGEIVSYEPDGSDGPQSPQSSRPDFLRDALFRSSKPVSLSSLFWRSYYYATCQVALPRRGWDVADTSVDDEVPTGFEAQPWNGEMICTHCASLCGSYTAKRSYVFNHPLELHLDNKEADITTLTDDPVPPRLVFQVLRVDGWERQFLEGYTFVDLPREPGSYNLHGSLWAPRGNLSERLSASFCGAFVPLASPELVAADELLQLPRNRSGSAFALLDLSICGCRCCGSRPRSRAAAVPVPRGCGDWICGAATAAATATARTARTARAAARALRASGVAPCAPRQNRALGWDRRIDSDRHETSIEMIP